jgi:uncharacterized membrane protein
VLGATVQASYECTVCRRVVDTGRHCNQLTFRVRGSPRLDNDVVNLLSSGVGGAVAVLLTLFTLR